MIINILESTQIDFQKCNFCSVINYIWQTGEVAAQRGAAESLKHRHKSYRQHQGEAINTQQILWRFFRERNNEATRWSFRPQTRQLIDGRKARCARLLTKAVQCVACHHVGRGTDCLPVFWSLRVSVAFVIKVCSILNKVFSHLVFRQLRYRFFT